MTSSLAQKRPVAGGQPAAAAGSGQQLSRQYDDTTAGSSTSSTSDHTALQPGETNVLHLMSTASHPHDDLVLLQLEILERILDKNVSAAGSPICHFLGYVGK